MAWLQANLGVFGVKLAVFLTLFGQETIMVLLLGYFTGAAAKRSASIWVPIFLPFPYGIRC